MINQAHKIQILITVYYKVFFSNRITNLRVLAASYEQSRVFFDLLGERNIRSDRPSQD